MALAAHHGLKLNGNRKDACSLLHSLWLFPSLSPSDEVRKSRHIATYTISLRLSVLIS